MDPATRYCNHCHEELPCRCPATRDYHDTLITRLCLGAVAEAEAEIDYLRGRLIDRTGDRYLRTLQRLIHLYLVKAWCWKQLSRRRAWPTLPVSGHDAIGARSVDSIPF